MLVPYVGRNSTDLARYSGTRGAVTSPRSWFMELWVRGRYVGLAR